MWVNVQISDFLCINDKYKSFILVLYRIWRLLYAYSSAELIVFKCI